MILPDNYNSILSINETESAIKLIKDTFQINLSSELCLRRITAPLFVKKGTGINDDLNGIEKPVSFNIKSLGYQTAEIVQSLAKWKRLALAELQINKGYGIYTDMNAIRPDEELSNIHSLYVDQWDWERVISSDERNPAFLKNLVEKIYGIFKRVEYLVNERFSSITPLLPEKITFIHSEDLCKLHPELTPKQRETKYAKEYGAIFVIGIGAELSDGKKHDGRAPDYDDWSTETAPGYFGLNGDIIFWNPVLKQAFEISSMGIRVDKESLLKQLDITGSNERKDLYWHRKLLKGNLPLSIGGGLGQSRICMYFLRKAHIGEIQASIWPDEMIAQCANNNIKLL